MKAWFYTLLDVKMCYCWRCGKTVPHKYVGKKSDFEGAGFARGFVAIATLGMSETAWATHYYQCPVCGRVRSV